jgi:predicted chitinase
MSDRLKPSPLKTFEGGLNPISDQKIGPMIDTKTSTPQGMLKWIAENKIYNTDLLEGVSEFKGQVYRIVDPKLSNIKDNAYGTNFLKKLNVEHLVCKVRIPEIHTHLPVPSTFDESKQDKSIIDLYQDFIYEPKYGMVSPISVGDIVTCTFGNLKTFSDGKIVAKVSSASDGQGAVKPVGASGAKQDVKKEFEKTQKYKDLIGQVPVNINKVFDTDLISLDDFKAFFKKTKRAENYYESFKALFKKYGVDTPAKVASLLGQISVETGNLKFVKELASVYNKKDPKDPNEEVGSLYEGRKTLGNTQVGDGPKFIGRGLVQLTGRANYESAGKSLGIDLTSDPELVSSSPLLAAETAFLFFKQKGLFDVAARNDFNEVTKRVNGKKMLEKEKRLEYTVNNLKILEKYVKS